MRAQCVDVALLIRMYHMYDGMTRSTAMRISIASLSEGVNGLTTYAYTYVVRTVCKLQTSALAVSVTDQHVLQPRNPREM